MIAVNKSPATALSPDLPERCEHDWQAQFERLLPLMKYQAAWHFRHLGAEARQEAVQCTLAHAWHALVYLARRGRLDVMRHSALVRYAVARTRGGRSLGTPVNVNDVMSTWCLQRRKVCIERLDEHAGGWREIVVADRRTNPADLAAFRIDIAAWLAGLSRRDRRLAETLALGVSTQHAAQQFNLSAGRVSQLRRELYAAWQRFQGELDTASELCTARASS
jgi:hypothetical protein